MSRAGGCLWGVPGCLWVGGPLLGSCPVPHLCTHLGGSRVNRVVCACFEMGEVSSAGFGGQKWWPMPRLDTPTFPPAPHPHSDRCAHVINESPFTASSCKGPATHLYHHHGHRPLTHTYTRASFYLGKCAFRGSWFRDQTPKTWTLRPVSSPHTPAHTRQYTHYIHLYTHIHAFTRTPT